MLFLIVVVSVLATAHGHNHLQRSPSGSGIVVARFEMRNHLVLNHPIAERVGERAFQSSAWSNIHFALRVLGFGFEQNHHAIVEFLLPYAPCVANLGGKLIRGEAFKVEHGENGDLVGSGARKLGKRVFQLANRGIGQDASVVVDILLRWRQSQNTAFEWFAAGDGCALLIIVGSSGLLHFRC